MPGSVSSPVRITSGTRGSASGGRAPPGWRRRRRCAPAGSPARGRAGRAVVRGVRLGLVGDRVGAGGQLGEGRGSWRSLQPRLARRTSHGPRRRRTTMLPSSVRASSTQRVTSSAFATYSGTDSPRAAARSGPRRRSPDRGCAGVLVVLSVRSLRLGPTWVGRLVRVCPRCTSFSALPREAGSMVADLKQIRRPIRSHVRGEQSCGLPSRALPSGSPLCGWGTVGEDGALHLVVRFTPTCVGSMPFGGTARTLPSVHPHVRGEHATPTARTAPSNGSPPRAWGASGTRAVRRTFSRFTPTCVGSMVKAGRE